MTQKLKTPPADGDVLKRSLAILALHRRDVVLEVIAKSARDLLRAPKVMSAIPKVLEEIGTASDVERVHLLSVDVADPLDASRIIRHQAWSAPGVVTPAEFTGGLQMTFAQTGLGGWAATLASGTSIVGHSRSFSPSARAFLKVGGIQSTAAVPVVVDGTWWGFIAFDACRSEREWLQPEVDALKILAELIGAAIASRRRQKKLDAANHIIENSPAIIYRLGPAEPFPLMFISQNVRRYGYEAADLLHTPTNWLTLVEGEDDALSKDQIRSVAAGRLPSADIRFRLRRNGGADVWFDGHIAPVRDDAGALIALEGVLSDVTERKKAEQELVMSNVLLATTFESSPDAMLVVDENARIVSFNRRFVEMWQIPEELVVARNDKPILARVAAAVKNESEFVARVSHLYEHPEIESHEELETKDGRFVDRHSAPLHGPDKKYLGRIWFFRDITARKTAEQQLSQLASTDALTGLHNRTAFLERLHLALARVKRSSNPFAILYIDLDGFKDVNDTLGHPAGDRLLQAVSDRLKASVRETDMVARFGGDEFAVLQDDVTDLAGTEALAEKIRKTLAIPYVIDGNDVHTTASIGIVPYQGGLDSAEVMMSRADLALYRAKGEGRNCYRFHASELDQQVLERVTIGHDLHKALERHELELYYQPEVDLRSGRIIGVEALVRWNHPLRGFLLPGTFIPIAESNGTIVPIGQWVLSEACRQIRAWRDEGVTVPTVAVNISVVQFKFATDLDRIVKSALDDNDIAPDALELELTESVLMETTQKHISLLDRLRDIGVHLAIDDFGTGFSSLDYLRTFRVSTLKIANQFVDDVATNPDAAAIVRATIGLAHALGMKVVAEGVNTAAQRAFLLSAGCRFAQGYALGKPMAADHMKDLLLKNAALQPA